MVLKKFCNHRGCNNLTADKYCEQHMKDERSYDRYRGSAHKRGYGSRWRSYRVGYLKLHPLCVCEDCKHKVVPLPANVVDHIVPHKGDKDLFWDPDNHQAMNKKCHDRKTVKEDGGFGRLESRTPGTEPTG